MKYIVVESGSLGELEDKVNFKIKQGWTPQGGVIHHVYKGEPINYGPNPNYSGYYTTWAQAMIKER